MGENLAERLIEALYAAAPVGLGCRVNHARGLLVEGVFLPSPDAERLTAATFFRAERPVLARFSSSTADPVIAQDSPNADPRGCAMRIGEGAETLVLVGHSIEGFPASDPAAFLDFLAALGGAHDDPATWAAHLDTHEAARRFVAERAAPLASFAGLTYHMLHPYRLTTPGRRPQIGRLRVVGLAEGAGAVAGADYLDQELRAQLRDGPVELRLEFQPSSPQDAVDDVSGAWSSAADAIPLGRVRLTHVSADQDAQRSLVFDPSVLPAGLAFAGDPMIAARLAAYRLAFARRTGAAPADAG